MSRNPVIKNKIFFIHFSLARISVLAPNSPTLYTRLGTPARKYFLWPGPGRGTESRLCNASPNHFVPLGWRRQSEETTRGCKPRLFKPFVFLTIRGCVPMQTIGRHTIRVNG